MADLEVERLSLKLSGYSEEQGRRLVRLIAEGLAAAPVNGAGNHPGVASRQATSPGTSVEDLSGRIVEDLLRQLKRSV